jgi:hypothetical protein
MPLTADLQTSFTSGGFSLEGAFDDLGSLLTDVGLPSLDLDVSVSLDVQGLGTDGISEVVGSLGGNLASISGALPDVEQLVGPLQLALRVPELLAGFDLEALVAELEASVDPDGPGLVALVQATQGIGALPGIGSVGDLLAALGLDLTGPSRLLGRTGQGVVSLAGLVGGLLAVEAASRRLETQAVLAADLLDAERLVGLVGRVRASGGPALASLVTGIDPDDAGLVELVAPPIQTYAALVAELSGALVRGLAFAHATAVDADFGALVTSLTAASLPLTATSPVAVGDLVASAAPLVGQLSRISVPDGGEAVLTGAVTQLRQQIETAIDGLEPSLLSGLVEPAVAPVLSTVRAVRSVVDEIGAVIGVAFAPLEQALDAVDLAGVGAAIQSVVEPVADTIDVVTDGIADAQGAIETAAAAVHDALTPVRAALTGSVGTLLSPFTEVNAVIAALDLQALEQTVRSTLEAAVAAISAAPVQPVFDVAAGAIGTTADALGLVPKALLPDDLRHALEAACAPIHDLDLEPARAELHAQLAALIDTIDASALEAVSAGYQTVNDFVDSIDPHPHVEQLETTAFAELTSALDSIDPTEILAPVIEALETARQAIAGIDLASLLSPIDEGLDQVSDTIESLDLAELLTPVTDALDQARTAVRDALHLDELGELLDTIDAAVASAVARVPVEDVLTALEGAWGDLVTGLQESAGVGAGALRGVLAGLLPGIPVEGLPEVIAWVRGERNGSTVVRDRLVRASATLQSASAAIGVLDVRAVTTELTATHQALTTALAAHPSDSLLVRTLSGPLLATDPAADLGRVVVNVDGARAAFASAAAVVQPATAADRSEVQLAADGLASAVAPLAPLLDTVRDLAAFVGLDPADLSGAGGVQRAVAGLAERLGPDVVIGTLRSIATHLVARIEELVHDGVVAPLKSVVDELGGLLDGLSVDALLADFTSVRDRLTALVDGLRPSTVLAAPLAAFAGLQHTLDTFDPMGPVRTVVDALRSEIDGFARDFAPTTLLAPVLTLYDTLAAAIGSFDVVGLLEPVLAALREIGRIIDRGMDEVIDALADLKAACESDGGPIPGLDLSVAASVDVGGLGL